MGCNLVQCEKEHQELNAALIASGIPDEAPNDFHSQISIHICSFCNEVFCGQHMSSIMLLENETDIYGDRDLIPGVHIGHRLSQSRCNSCWNNGIKWIVKKA